MNVVENYVTSITTFARGGALDMLYIAVVHLGSLFALIVGRRLERAVGGLYLALLVIGFAVADMQRPTTPSAQAAWAIGGLILMAAIALRRGAPAWTLFAAAFQLVETITWLLALAAAVPVSGFAFLTIVRAWEYLFVLSLVIGAWSARFPVSEPPSGRGVGLQGPAPGGAR